MRKIIIYTDGSCYPNPGKGGWAAILKDEKTGREKEIQGSQKSTTAPRMELTAVIRALESLKFPCDVIIYTDSEYVQQGISKWIGEWKIKKWPKRIKNQDLWKILDRLRMDHNIDWQWVQAHVGNPGNERVDQLAVEARRM